MKNTPIQQIIDCGIVPYFVRFLKIDENPILQFEAAWAITNIASSETSDHLRYLIDAGAVPILIRLLSSPSDEVKAQVVWALRNITDDVNGEYREIVLAAGALPAFIEAAKDCQEPSKLNIMTQIANAILCLSHGKPFPDLKQALPLLGRLLSSNIEELVECACFTLCNITIGANTSFDDILQKDLNIVSRLMEVVLVGNRSTIVRRAAIKTLGSIASGDERHTQSIIVTLPSLLWLLDYPDKGIRTDVCWALSNMTAGTKNQLQAVIDAAIFPKLFELIRSSDLEVQVEAGHAVANATRGNENQVWYLIHEGVIPVFCSLLQEEYLDSVGIEILFGLSKVLHAGKKRGRLEDVIRMVLDCDGIERIKKLQNHENNGISTRSKKIVDTFFG